MAKTKPSPEPATTVMQDVIAELAILKTILVAFEQLNEEARFRNMKYLVDRYSKYVPSSNY